jgi:hypothetical protein
MVVVTIDFIHELLKNNHGKRFMIHDGYDGWSYGVPYDPIYITPGTATALINYIIKKKKIPAIELLYESRDIEYCDENEQLYLRTRNCRIIGLYSPDLCKFEERSPSQKEVEILF